MSRGLKFRLASVMLAVFALFSCTILAFQLVFYRENLIEQQKSILTFYAEQMVNSLHHEVYEQVRGLQFLANHPKVVTIDPRAELGISNYLKSFMATQTEVGFLEILTKDGIVRASSEKSRVGEDLSKSEEFLKIKEGLDVYVADMKNYGDDIKIIIGVQIIAPDGNFFGTVRAEYKFSDNIRRSFTLFEREQRLGCLLLDQGGTIRLASNDFKNLTGTRPSQFFAAGSQHYAEISGEGYIVGRFEGMGYKSYLGKSVTALMLKKESEVLASLYTFLKLFGAFTFASAAVFIILGMVVGRNMLRPIGELIRFTRQITSTGDLDKRCVIKTSDEVGELAESFNEMLVRLSSQREKIKTGEERNKRLIEAASQLGEGMLVIQEHGDQPWSIVDWNAAAEKMLGLETGFEGLPSLSDHLSIQDNAQFFMDITALKNKLNNKIPSAKLKLFSKNRETSYSVELSATCMDYQGENSVAILFRDISEREELQRQLIESQKMEALGAMAGGFAHDFNNILTGFFGYIALLKNKSADDRAKHYLQELEKIASRGSDIVKTMLIFSRRKPQVILPVKIGDVIGEALSFTKSSFPKNIEIKREGSFDVLVSGDHSQLVQVFLNVLINAKDAITETGASKGRITVRTSEIAFDLPQTLASSRFVGGKYLKIEVEDNGMGMTEDVKNRIFEPFFTTKGELGTGMGLAISYRIIKNHDGDIIVDSKPKIGTTVSVILPIASGRQISITPAAIKQFRPGLAMLIVDDEPTIRESLKVYFETQGFNVRIASNGLLALDAIEKYPPDIILLDIMMPKLDGISVLKKIKEANRPIKIIIMSGEVSMQDKVNLADAAMQKPFTLSEISSAVHDLLHGAQEENSKKIDGGGDREDGRH